MRHFPSSSSLSTAFAILSIAGSFLALGCSDEETPEKTCGGVERDGTCYKLCDESKCQTDNYCITTDQKPEGFCALLCWDNTGCPVGYTCENHPRLGGETDLSFCMNLGLPSDGAMGTSCTGDDACDTGHGLQCIGGKCTIPGYPGTPCTGDDKCDKTQGLSCIKGTCTRPTPIGEACTDSEMCSGDSSCLGGICTFACNSPLAPCQDGYHCVANPAATGDQAKGMCAKGAGAVAGQYGTLCPSGKDDVCDTTNGFGCVGPTGEGYCSKLDGCAADADCPAGYWCSTLRVGLDDKNIDFTKRPHACLKRDWCAPCTTDFDCGTTNAVCVADKNGEKFCSMPCELGGNSCIIGAECVDQGGGKGACIPDVGVCHDASPKGCSPCRNDADCGDSAICAGGAVGYKPGMSWCMTPCGEENGKHTCPAAPNGLEMLCLDADNYDLGGPFSSDMGNYLFEHCYAPFTVDNTEKYPTSDPPRNECGNYVREPGEECDDGNANATDGCDKCKVTDACTFTVTEPNGDVWAGLSPALDKEPGHIAMVDGYDPNMKWVISTQNCGTFKIKGAIETAGDVDTVAFRLLNEQYVWVETFTGNVGECTGDLRTEVRAWGDGETPDKLNMMDQTVTCEKLSSEVMDLANNKLCADGKLGCGSCTQNGLCGSCDNDNGLGACNRMLISTSTKLYSQYTVKFDGKYRMIRLYAQDPTATVSNYTIVVQKFVAQANIGTTTPPALSCY